MFNLPGIFFKSCDSGAIRTLDPRLEGRCSIQLSYGTILICGAKVVILF